MNDSPLFSLLALLLLAAPAAYLFGRVVPGLRIGRLTPARWIALLALAGAWIPFAAAQRAFVESGPPVFRLGGISLEMDGIGLLLAALALGLGGLVTVFSGPAEEGEDGEEKYFAMLLAMVGAMVGLGCAADLFNLWLWFEAMTISSYLLVAFHRDQPASLEAGVKYLVQSAAGSVFVLLGIAVVLANTGTLDLAEIALHPPEPALLAAAGLFITGYGVKAALVPLHTWLPDAHSQAPSGISAMLSGVVIEAALVALLRALAVTAGVVPSWGALLIVLGAVNMLAGNLLALVQREVKRLLAYSSVSHLGYILMGLGFSLEAGQAAGAQGGLFHLLNHGLMKGLAFLAAGALIHALRLQMGGSFRALVIDDLDGAYRRYPLVAITFSLAVLSLAGLPPLAGFMSKWQIIAAGVAGREAWLIGMAHFAGFNSMLSFVYYLPLVSAVYRGVPSPAVQAGSPVPGAMQVPLLALALAIAVLGIWPGLAGGLVEPAGAALMEMFR
ncbi:MAG TPA: proton-conducting transporter membrane subunit [Anaerolineales bacterium]|nr:proton-conducting transporter membrane subunit [Anaerolineales bacterium]